MEREAHVHIHREEGGRLGSVGCSRAPASTEDVREARAAEEVATLARRREGMGVARAVAVAGREGGTQRWRECSGGLPTEWMAEDVEGEGGVGEGGFGLWQRKEADMGGAYGWLDVDLYGVRVLLGMRAGGRMR